MIQRIPVVIAGLIMAAQPDPQILPGAKEVQVLRRLEVDAHSELILAIGRSQRSVPPAGGRFVWSTRDRIALVLREKPSGSRMATLAIQPGPNDDCYARVERMTARELVLSCIGEKWSTYDNQKFVYDPRSGKPATHFAYRPYQFERVVNGTRFLMTDGEHAALVDCGPSLRVTPAGAPPEPVPASPFGLGSRFHLAARKNVYGSDYPVIVERRSSGERIYPLPQTDLSAWRAARPDDAKTGARPDPADENEQIGPHQAEGTRLWFGKTFYNSEGLTGVGGFGYFDTTSHSYTLYSPPEIRRSSVSALLVEPEAVWLGLFRRGEYGNTAGGLLRWDRSTHAVTHFAVRAEVHGIVLRGDALYLGATDGVVVLRHGHIRSYFVDRSGGGGLQMAERM